MLLTAVHIDDNEVSPKSSRFKNPKFFFKKPNPVGFFGFYWGFVLDKHEKIAKIIQKLSNLKR